MRPVHILYVLVIYVLIQFCWWAYLLVDLNDEVYEHRIENVHLKSHSRQEEMLAVQQLEEKITQRRWMVVGEGCVFLGLLAWGSVVTLRSFRKEMALARQQKNFLLSVTHEFKSPLASIKLYLQTILKHDLDKEKESSFINSAIHDTERLNNLVENAMLANLIDHKGYSFNKENLNLSALVRLLVQKFQSLPNHNPVETSIDDSIMMYADKNALGILIGNLLENAMKYSFKTDPVSVSLKKQPDKITLCIRDTGFGIADNEKKKIFQKFYRVGNEETRKTKGTGLGLFIVKHITEGHNGSIKVFNNKPRGTAFSIEFRN